MSIFVSCGEVSGDLYAADLIEELQKLSPDLRGNIWGVLGPRGIAAGGHAVRSYEELKLMGITEVLPAIPRILRLRDDIVRTVLQRNPRAVVVVDSPDFHFSLVKKLRREGYKGLTVFLVTPTVWAWRKGRTRLLRRYFDLSLPLFSFEQDFLTVHGVRSKWTAHPLVESLARLAPPKNLTERYAGAKIIALMPGSRHYDIKYHLSQLLETAALLKHENFLPVFSIAPGLSESLQTELRERTREFENWSGEGRDLMAVSEAVAGVSGTVAVEAMLLRRFMVVIYNGQGLSWLLARLLVRIPYISIPNYLTDSPVYPELLKDDMRPDRIVKELYGYLDNPLRKAEIDERLEKARQAMGTARASVFWARSILEDLEARKCE